MNATKDKIPAAPCGCKHSGWKAQFGQPSGALGWAVGYLMALKNAPINRLAVEMLNVQSDDQILEIGFGPGLAIRSLAERVERAFVDGIDISEVMFRQAASRNRKFIRTGRVELKVGDVSKLPYEDGRFTKVFTVNTFHHWPAQEESLLEVRRVLTPGGLLLLCMRMKHPSRSFMVAPGLTAAELQAVGKLLERTGFSHIQTKKYQAGREVACLTAQR